MGKRKKKQKEKDENNIFEIDVFERTKTKAKLIDPKIYNLIIGLTLCWGFALNWLIVSSVPTEFLLSINKWVFFIGYFISCLIGVSLFNDSEKPWVSFAGYNLVVIPFGLILNLIISQYDEAIVIDAVRITGLVTAWMMVLASLFPKLFRKAGKGLTVALFVVIIVEWLDYLFFNRSYGFFDWVLVLIFCGYIGYDWGKANRIPKTVDNAIDSAAALYMDIINLFIRILRIFGRKK